MNEQHSARPTDSCTWTRLPDVAHPFETHPVRFKASCTAEIAGGVHPFYPDNCPVCKRPVRVEMTDHIPPGTKPTGTSKERLDWATSIDAVCVLLRQSRERGSPPTLAAIDELRRIAGDIATASETRATPDAWLVLGEDGWRYLSGGEGDARQRMHKKTDQLYPLYRGELKAADPLLACVNVPALIAHANAAVDLAHNRLIRINELEAQLARLNGAVTPETSERRLAEACERLRRCAALVAMGGDQSMALAINRHSERLLGDISAWSERETSEKANDQADTPRFEPAIEAEGMAWWNDCTPNERRLWLKIANSAAPADAWQAFRTSPPSILEEWNAEVEHFKKHGGEMPNDPE